MGALVTSAVVRHAFVTNVLAAAAMAGPVKAVGATVARLAGPRTGPTDARLTRTIGPVVDAAASSISAFTRRRTVVALVMEVDIKATAQKRAPRPLGPVAIARPPLHGLATPPRPHGRAAAPAKNTFVTNGPTPSTLTGPGRPPRRGALLSRVAPSHLRVAPLVITRPVPHLTTGPPQPRPNAAAWIMLKRALVRPSRQARAPRAP